MRPRILALKYYLQDLVQDPKQGPCKGCKVRYARVTSHYCSHECLAKYYDRDHP